jgi:deaminated glutathione amidase
MPISSQKSSRSGSKGRSSSIYYHQCLSASLLSYPIDHSDQPQALFLPEASDYIASSPNESLSLCQPASTSPFVRGLQSTARTHSLPINVGIHEPTTPPSSRLANTCIWINSSGEISHRYQKLHLIDIDLRDEGGPLIKESNNTEPGKRIEEPYEPVQGLGKFGTLICFDLRFAEPSLILRRLGADIILYPSAFTVPTGKLHWEALLRARAIETQCWVIAAAQSGRHNGKRVSYGDSIVIDPNGKIMGRLSKVENADEEKEGDEAREPELLIVDIDLTVNRAVRKSIPVEDLRRTDVYPKL